MNSRLVRSRVCLSDLPLCLLEVGEVLFAPQVNRCERARHKNTRVFWNIYSKLIPFVSAQIFLAQVLFYRFFVVFFQRSTVAWRRTNATKQISWKRSAKITNSGFTTSGGRWRSRGSTTSKGGFAATQLGARGLPSLSRPFEPENKKIPLEFAWISPTV